MEEPKLLSGKQLVQNGTPKGDSFLPEKLHKESVPSRSWVERKSIQYYLENHRKILGDQRVQKRGMLTQARWLPEQEEALVLEKRGNHWLHMGTCREQHTYLLPEETLFLMEMNSLELKYGNVSVSIQQAYSILLGRSVSFDQYRVYSTLSKQGYKLLRHDTQKKYIYDDMDSSLERCASPAGTQSVLNTTDEVIDEIMEEVHEKNDKNVGKQADKDCVIVAESKTMLDDVEKLEKVVKDDGEGKIKVEQTNSGTLDGSTMLDDAIESEVIDLDAIAAQKAKAKIYANIVDCYCRNIVCVPAPNVKYIPKNVEPSKEIYIIKVSNLYKRSICDAVVSRDPRLKNLPKNGAARSGNNSFSTGRRENNPRINNFSNNSLFYNHIFQQTQYKNICSYGVVDYRQFTGGSFLGNMQFVRNNFSFQQTEILRPFNFNMLPLNARRQELVNPFSNVELMKHGTQQKTLRRKRRNSRDPRYKCKRRKSNPEISGKKQATDMIKSMIDRYNMIGESSRTQVIKNNLKNIVEKVNAVFKENYTLQFSGNIVKLVDATKASEKIVQLSSDSDSSDDDTTKTNKTKCQPVQKRRVSIYDSLTETSDDNFSDPEICFPIDKEVKDIFGDWVSETNGWNDVMWNKNLKTDNAISYSMLRSLIHKNGINLTSWKQMKSIGEKLIISDTIAISDDSMDDDIEESAPAEHDLKVKVDKTEPLIRPEDCKTITSVLDRLSIIKSPEEVEIYSPEDGSVAGEEEGRLRVCYDLYMPDHKSLKKSDPPPPAYSLIILSQWSPLPLPCELAASSRSLPACVPSLLAIVSHDSISFLQMENIRLPQIVSDVDILERMET